MQFIFYKQQVHCSCFFLLGGQSPYPPDLLLWDAFFSPLEGFQVFFLMFQIVTFWTRVSSCKNHIRNPSLADVLSLGLIDSINIYSSPSEPSAVFCRKSINRPTFKRPSQTLSRRLFRIIHLYPIVLLPLTSQIFLILYTDCFAFYITWPLPSYSSSPASFMPCIFVL